ncbi:transcription intermediary factor 1-beta isoform X2 [Cinclus cinclus]|uniref:transcription intermediary factor 1-beta isoform X2 n=1 Tax=Cinclus cinclus TaxID=127875 RepID=UPI002E0FBBBF
MSMPLAVAVENGLGAKGAGPPEPLELCGACRERLSPQREPWLLPCLHSVCRECLGTTPGAAGSEGQVFDCPVCHQQCPLSDIMENFFLQDSGAGTALGQGSGQVPQRVPCPQTCTNCEDNAAATSFCLECAEPLCDTCVEAHQRVRYTRDHTVRALGGLGPSPGPCRAHPTEPLALFCSTCDTLTCRACHLGSHRDHPSQPLEDAVRRQRSVLAALLQRLSDKHAVLQRSTKELHAFIRRVTDVQKRVQVEVKMAVLQIMKELNKRGKVLVSDAQRVTEGRQEQLERQHRALSRAQRQQEHVLRFAARALDSPHGTALLLSRRLIHSQLLRALRVTVEPLEPQGDMKFQWDLQAWTKSAESFGTIISEHPLPPSLSPPPLLSPPAASPRDPSPTSQGPPQATVISGGQVTPELLLQEQEPHWAPESPECPPQLSPPHLDPQPPETPELATSPPENSVTGMRRRKPGSSPNEEKFVKKLLIKRRGPPGAQDSPRLPKVPRVSLERLELDLELDPAQPPMFRIFPGPSAEEFSVIVIEQGRAGTPGAAGTMQPHRAFPVKVSVPCSPPVPTQEEQQESPIGDIRDTKPVGLLPPPPGEPGPVPGSSPGLGLPVVPAGLPVAPAGLPVGVPGLLGVSCCRVCGQAGAVVMCDCCQRCFHLHCHLPALQDVPSPEWTCLLCQELPPPSLDMEQGSPLKMSPQDQQRCEFVLLELLCHEPCRPLHRLSSSPDGRDAIDLTLMRARLQEKLSPHYRSPEEFARDGWQLLRQFHRLTEDKADVQSILELQRFLESRLSAVFGDQKFSRLLLDPEESLEMFPVS